MLPTIAAQAVRPRRRLYPVSATMGVVELVEGKEWHPC